MRFRRRTWFPAAALLLTLSLATGSRMSLARFTDATVPTGSFASDTLAPPTALGATGGATVALTWTPTVDVYASGYTVWRGSASGGPYTSIGSVTPRTSTSTTDSPAAGTWYYVLRSTFQSWASVDSTQASAAVPAHGAYAACTNQAADTTGAGDNNGYQTSAAGACADGGTVAQDPNSGTGGTQSCGTTNVPDATKDRHRYWGFATGTPGTATAIQGIRVRADLGMNNTTGTTAVCAQLSWNGGTTWTDLRSVALTATAQTTFTFGGQTDTWGRTWTASELSTTNFRVRVVNASTLTTKRFDLDYVAVSVSYVP